MGDVIGGGGVIKLMLVAAGAAFGFAGDMFCGDMNDCP